MEHHPRFNVRVYFILMNETEDAILVADEIIQGEAYTKFPGGGLEWGEGTIDCAEREALEELGQAIQVKEHFYTTDFFIQSAFRETDQVISIYYTASLLHPQLFRSSDRKNDFSQQISDEESFRWISIQHLSEDEFHFPADRHVASLLIERLK